MTAHARHATADTHILPPQHQPTYPLPRRKTYTLYCIFPSRHSFHTFHNRRPKSITTPQPPKTNQAHCNSKHLTQQVQIAEVQPKQQPTNTSKEQGEAKEMSGCRQRCGKCGKVLLEQQRGECCECVKMCRSIETGNFAKFIRFVIAFKQNKLPPYNPISRLKRVESIESCQSLLLDKPDSPFKHPTSKHPTSKHPTFKVRPLYNQPNSHTPELHNPNNHTPELHRPNPRSQSTRHTYTHIHSHTNIQSTRSHSHAQSMQFRSGKQSVKSFKKLEKDQTSSSKKQIVEYGYFCDECKVCPIEGRRFHCERCADYDLCQRCYFQLGHKHEVTAFKESKQEQLKRFKAKALVQSQCINSALPFLSHSIRQLDSMPKLFGSYKQKRHS